MIFCRRIIGIARNWKCAPAIGSRLGVAYGGILLAGELGNALALRRVVPLILVRGYRSGISTKYIAGVVTGRAGLTEKANVAAALGAAENWRATGAAAATLRRANILYVNGSEAVEVRPVENMLPYASGVGFLV